MKTTPELTERLIENSKMYKRASLPDKPKVKYILRTVWVFERQSGSLLYTQVSKRGHVFVGEHFNMII